MDLKNGDKFSSEMPISCDGDGCSMSGSSFKKMKHREAIAHIQWIGEECVGFKCECGAEEIVVDINSRYDENSRLNKCPLCGKQYILKQSNEVFEVEEE